MTNDEQRASSTTTVEDQTEASTSFGGVETAVRPALDPGVLPEQQLVAPSLASIDAAIAAASDWLLARQAPAGFWRGELEADTTCESYIVLLRAFLGQAEHPDVPRLARVIREEALPAGGFAKYPGGPPDVSVSCLSYFALKIAGDDAEAPHMRATRGVIAHLGGVEQANSYAKYHLAMFGQYPWSKVPAIPPEMIFLPPGAPFSIYDMSSWSRTIFVPLSIVYAHKPVRPLPRGAGVGELFVGDGHARNEAVNEATTDRWRRFFLAADRALKAAERVPGLGLLRTRALDRAHRWMLARLEASDGLGAILPAMANSVLALVCLGYPIDHPLVVRELRELERLALIDDEAGTTRIQPCLSPLWDTCLVAHALAATDRPDVMPALGRATDWLVARQSRHRGDWAERNDAPPGGWAFEFRNDWYPDVDDTAMALLVLQHAPIGPDTPDDEVEAAARRGLRWLLGMQNDDGGWASFDRGNDREWLTRVPFADHNAMIDPSTADITGRVLECLGTFEAFHADHPVVRRAVRFLERQQNPDGSWYGRWGVNYLYGTAQVLRGLRAVGAPMNGPSVVRAVRWLIEHQNPDGGWGETIASYDDPSMKGCGPSTPSQTAWAVQALVTAFEGHTPAARRGVRFLLSRQRPDGTWDEDQWTGTGFPRVFYLRYHLYRHHFPLGALAHYRRNRQGRPGAKPRFAHITI